MRAVKVPLAAKVLLAFVAVIGAGALPVQYSLRKNIHTAVAAQLGNDLLVRANLLAAQLSPQPRAEWPAITARLSSLFSDRVTLISHDGKVLFESQPVPVTDMSNHLDRPEIAQALSAGIGSDLRVSSTLHDELIYVAVAITNPAGEKGILRFSRPASDAADVAAEAATLLWRGTAVSISIALLLSFLAILVIVRPLQRMRDAAMALAQGELNVHVDVSTRDELDDVARALEKVGAQLRHRLAHAGGGEALLGQFTHAMVQGVVIIGNDNRVHHVNGVARAQLGLRGPQESERLAKLLSSEQVVQAIKLAAKDPLGVDMRVPHPVTGELVDGTVIALRRLDGEPLNALVLDVQGTSPITMADVPEARDVVAVPLRELMDRALARVREDLDEGNATFVPPDEWPATAVADVGGRVESVVMETLKAAARAPGVQLSTPLSASVQNGCVVVHLPVSLPSDLLKNLEPRISPLGGRMAQGQGNVQLWLPRA